MAGVIRVVAALLLVVLCGTAPVLTVQSQPPEPPEGFLPIDQVPPEDQLPAAPLLVTAYVFVVLVLFAYLLSLSRRVGVVQKEVARLEADLKKSSRA